MNPHIKKAFEDGRLILLIGAGASKSSINRLGKEVPIGDELATIIAASVPFEYNGEPLSKVYRAAKSTLGNRIEDVLADHLKHITPSAELLELVKYPFPRIYTLNIDDAFEKAAHKNCTLKFNTRNRNEKIVEIDQLCETMDLIKLNGDINFPTNGFIFSSQEYGQGSAEQPLWYTELARDYYKYTFLFIGTKINEPLFFHQIETFKQKTGSKELKSYILVPTLTTIEKIDLEESNIHHLPGTLTDLTNWLKLEFPTPPTSVDLLKIRRPELNITPSLKSGKLNVFSGVTPVNRVSISLLPKTENQSDIRDFFKGFKPSWFDITDEIPALLGKTKKIIYDLFTHSAIMKGQLFLVLGSAGCGKSTTLKQIALIASEKYQINTYYIDEYKENLEELISELDLANKEKYIIIIERIGDLAHQIANILRAEKSNKAIFISAENINIWSHRVKEHLNNFLTYSIDISQLENEDADLILEKIEKHGNWTRLAKMSLQKRRVEILKKSKHQLLIGLIEATSGEGFYEIIKKDFAKIKSTDQKQLLILSGLATIQRVPANEATLTRAMSYLGANQDIYSTAKQMEGILKYENGNITTRHRIYIENIFNHHVSVNELHQAITAYIKAFSVYKTPVVKNLSRNEALIYKYLVNAKSLKKLLQEDQDLIFNTYQKFEKIFENDGLFLMQYGLALRMFGKNAQAYEKLRIAHEAYPESEHIEHALAQQRIIRAIEEPEENIAMIYFKQAEEVLKRLDKSDIMLFDRYPIITLSEGHIQLFDRMNKKSEARTLARMYHDNIQKRISNNDNIRIKKTLQSLMKYSINGIWQNTEDEYEYV